MYLAMVDIKNDKNEMLSQSQLDIELASAGAVQTPFGILASVPHNEWITYLNGEEQNPKPG